MGSGLKASGYSDLPMSTVYVLQLQLQGMCCFCLGSRITHPVSLLKHADVRIGLDTKFYE